MLKFIVFLSFITWKFIRIFLVSNEDDEKSDEEYSEEASDVECVEEISDIRCPEGTSYVENPEETSDVEYPHEVRSFIFFEEISDIDYPEQSNDVQYPHEVRPFIFPREISDIEYPEETSDVQYPQEIRPFIFSQEISKIEYLEETNDVECPRTANILEFSVEISNIEYPEDQVYDSDRTLGTIMNIQDKNALSRLFTAENRYADFIIKTPYSYFITVKDTYLKARKKEEEIKIPEDYLEGSNCPPTRREQAVNWLVCISKRESKPQTFQRAIAIFDRYVNKRRTCHAHDLTATMALVISEKFDNDRAFAPMHHSICLLTDKYTRKRMKKKESDILQTLDYDLLIPLPCDLMERLNMVLDEDPERCFLSKFFSEVALVDYDMCHFVPSLLTAASVCLALAIRKDKFDFWAVWTSEMIHYTGYLVSDLKPVLFQYITVLSRIMDRPDLSSVYEKFTMVLCCKEILDRVLTGALITGIVCGLGVN